MGENAEMETSLNLNISSISDTPEEGLNHDSEKKKKIQPFCETRERQWCPSYKARARQWKVEKGECKEAAEPSKETSQGKEGSPNKKGQKKDNETMRPVKSKRKTKVPAKFLDGIDFSKHVNTNSLSDKQISMWADE